MLAAVTLLTLGAAACTTQDAKAEAKPEASKTEETTVTQDPKQTFQKPSDAELRARLTPQQYEVTQCEGTEGAFRNAYWNNKEAGIYVDIVSGEPLFSSLDKFDSGTGWPSFTKPLSDKAVTTKTDHKLWSARVEVRSAVADSHLGHVFDDGPGPTGLRYCMNSASLRFIPVAQLEAEGLGRFLPMFGKTAGGGTAEVATLAGGCFWGMEEIIRGIPGVLETHVGYTGGNMANATYKNHDGHAEAIKVTFDPAKLSYKELLGWFFRMHDPTTKDRQGNDVGTSYRSAIFFHSPAQKATAEEVIKAVNATGKWKRPIVTEVTAASAWWDAEDDHQDYLQKNPGGYTCHYLRD